ncbi:hypothetical protein HX017_15505 [Myroides marinus]|uniref:DUF6046 domain-containing protein n=1 Tax=Myroides TaxID=76831 RepID=UPI002577A80E|nr:MULTISPECIES: DUF6046 domain-containing protein [Myroides]MDM1033827.1 hypothetical protein [Myroides odoratimimus]MDM1366347.1 hypothetical protein [Myroides marinus]
MNEMVVASLFGSKIIQQVPRIANVENRLSKHVLPVLPYPQWLKPVQVKDEKGNVEGDQWKANQPVSTEEQFFPLSLSIDGSEWFTLPYEPMINVQGKNNVIKRSVLKYNDEFTEQFFGTVKERWSQDDYKIKITGIFFGANEMGVFEDSFPRSEFEKLKSFLLSGKEIQVRCPLLELLDINYIAIEDFNFPFTKGENVQAYEINAISDMPFHALIVV